MPILQTIRDAKEATLDLRELLKKKAHGGILMPPGAKPFNKAGRPAGLVRLPWTYDLDWGWTPEREKADPRPPLNLPPYYNERFTFRTGGLKTQTQNAILIDLRSFPRGARVFVRLPVSLLRSEVHRALRRGRAHAPDGAWATVPVTPDDYNQLFGEQEPASLGSTHVLVELAPRRRAVVDQLQLGPTPVDIEVRYAVSRTLVRPKSMHVIHFGQLMDGFLVGEFEHVFQAYHPYDVPMVGDWRTHLVYRRSSWEVSTIPPLALAFFDSWEHAAASGFDPAPRSFARHFRPEHVSAAQRQRILDFVNAPSTDAEMLHKRVRDNPHVGTKGLPDPHEKEKVGLTKPTARRILAARDRLPGRRFACLEQIDAVAGVGPDTMSDMITSFLIARDDHGKWYPNPKVVSLLRR
ncbi:MAG: hypothetical protein RBU30_01755 [Polyangia bacterium]|jgi:hypothetical protein|nr:hypothetical protein [Polyangia bacterium]